MDLEPILERAKLHLNVKSDAELARHLGISRQELHQYKKKSSIPYKYFSSKSQKLFERNCLLELKKKKISELYVFLSALL